MKNVLFLVLIFLGSISLKAQDCSELKNDSEIRSELQDLANTAASDLMGCCSKWGGNNLKAEIFWDKDENGDCQTRISKITGKITITMKVSWTGSVSGTYYWIKGKLVYDTENRTRTWIKISDSGGFSPGCSNGCIK